MKILGESPLLMSALGFTSICPLHMSLLHILSASPTSYHSAIFCNFFFELIPSDITIPTKSTCKQTDFFTERFV
jgi:hypothetical protein